MANYQLLKILTLREIRERYLSSIGGFAWVVVIPLAQLAIYAFVFTRILQIRIPDAETTGFVPFLAVALWPWTAFSDGLTRGTTAITENQALIGKVAVPHAVLVLSNVTAAFCLALAGYVAVLLVMALLGVHIHLLGLLVSVWVLLQIYLLTLALALFCAAVQVFMRDLSHALTPLLMLGFFATPILYSLEMVPTAYRGWLSLNPFSYFVDRLRDGLLGGQWQWGLQDWVMPLAVLVMLGLGYAFFKRLSPRFEDFL